jgi:hypothetical protein
MPTLDVEAPNLSSETETERASALKLLGRASMAVASIGVSLLHPEAAHAAQTDYDIPIAPETPTIPAMPPTPQTGFKPGSDIVYTVKPGDSFWKIGAAEHVNPLNLELINRNLRNFHFIRPGEEILVTKVACPTDSGDVVVDPAETRQKLEEEFHLTATEFEDVNPNLSGSEVQPGDCVDVVAPVSKHATWPMVPPPPAPVIELPTAHAAAPLTPVTTAPNFAPQVTNPPQVANIPPAASNIVPIRPNTPMPHEENIPPAVPSPTAKIATESPAATLPPDLNRINRNIHNQYGAFQPAPETTPPATTAPAPAETEAPHQPKAPALPPTTSKLFVPSPPPPTSVPKIEVPKLVTPTTGWFSPVPPKLAVPIPKTIEIPTDNNIAAVQAFDGKSAEEIQAELKFIESYGTLPVWAAYTEGDFFGESGDRTTAVGDGGISFGLFQANGERAVGLPSDWYGQAAFAFKDMQGPHGYPPLWVAMHTIPNPSDALIQYMFAHWERYKAAGSRYDDGKRFRTEMETPVQAKVLQFKNIDGIVTLKPAA